ncbi:DUF2125 domain-containing protein [Bosea sp. 117]|uniref:DUF2125 domain-containing protein n=1 Tax=Bosea sp. 117 TaxID=1125973 RepID=UPI0004944222|nr:DUF2125 domain-containing protein [Bosea sp. 117]
MSHPEASLAGPSTPRRRAPWIVIAPVAILLLLAAGWTAAWFYASSRVQDEINHWVVREAAQGRNWSCGSLSFGGFPFRFELICEAPSLAFTGASQWKADAARAHAVAQVWDPQHIIAEFKGPARIVETATGKELTANWSLLQASGVGANGKPERVSVSANDYALTQGSTSLFAAKHVEVHVRHHPGDAGPTLDVAAGMHAATGPALGGTAPAPVDGELQAQVTAVPEFRSMPLDERLRLWQGAGGRLNLVLGKLSSGGGTMVTTGNLGLDDRGRPSGEAQLSVVGPERLVAALGASGLMPADLAGFAPMVMAAGTPTQVDGRKGAAFPFQFRDGRVFLGFIPLGKIGPLY